MSAANFFTATKSLNETIFRWFFEFGQVSPILGGLVWFVAVIGIYLLALLLLVFIFRAEKSVKEKILMFCEAGLSFILARGIITELLHFIYLSPRPPAALGIEPLVTASGSSFPSGHAVSAVVLGLTLALWSRGPLRRGALVAALLISFSRISAGVHWPLDVLGSIVIGTLSVFLVRSFLRGGR